jgi:hypothetical protein
MTCPVGAALPLYFGGAADERARPWYEQFGFERSPTQALAGIVFNVISPGSIR